MPRIFEMPTMYADSSEGYGRFSRLLISARRDTNRSRRSVRRDDPACP
jgi:hypothetical protein